MVDESNFTNPRLILRDNLKACMTLKDYPNTQLALEEKSKVGQNTISRILSDEGQNATIENIAKLAKAYDLAPWQLLVPAMDPRNEPVLQPASAAQKALWKQIQTAFTELPAAPESK